MKFSTQQLQQLYYHELPYLNSVSFHFIFCNMGLITVRRLKEKHIRVEYSVCTQWVPNKCLPL